MVTTLHQELQLYQEHATELTRLATQEISSTHAELFQEREQHQRAKAELAKLQQFLDGLQPSLQRLAQRLRVSILASAAACNTL